MPRRVTYALRLSPSQLSIVHEALVLAAAAGQGSFEGVQRWWGDEGGHGNCLKGQLESLTKKMCKLHPRRIQEAPMAAKLAWDISSAINTARAAIRLKRIADYAAVPWLTGEPPARLDVLQSGDSSRWQVPLKELEKVPLSPVLPPLRIPRAPRAAAPEHPLTDSITKPKTGALLKKRGKK